MNAMAASKNSTDIVRTLSVINQKGIHARAAAKFVKLAEQFNADVKVTHKDQTVCGRSILELLMLAASQGSSIEIRCNGNDAEAASNALSGLVENKFDEEA